MTRISQTFARLRKTNDKALITYIMAGDPSMAKTKELVFALEEGGADIIELGVPFSDPLADGPVIQRAAERALSGGATLIDIFNLVNAVRKKSQIPIVLMTYYNIVFKYDEKSFVRDAVRAGVDGVIVPDLPPEEGQTLIEAARKEGLDVIFLLSPTSRSRRVAAISKKSRGFIYYVSLTGVTGMREQLSATIGPMIRRIKGQTKKPVVAGFGISNVEQAAQVSSYSDGVVIGSALVRLVEEDMMGGNAVSAVRDFVNSVKIGMRHTEETFEENTQLLGSYLKEKI